MDGCFLSPAARRDRTSGADELPSAILARVRDFRIVAGYSGTPLPIKLGIKEGALLAVLNVPPGVLTELPPGVVVKRQARGKADVVVAFFTRRTDLQRRLPMLAKMIFPSGGLWIAWPKRAFAVETDITDGVIREAALPLGLVDNKVCAVDETWSGLRVVWRLEHRAVPMLGGCACSSPVPGRQATSSR
jgi:hypothetical protein